MKQIQPAIVRLRLLPRGVTVVKAAGVEKRRQLKVDCR